jgi:hypothetical protein
MQDEQGRTRSGLEKALQAVVRGYDMQEGVRRVRGLLIAGLEKGRN